MVKQEYRNLTQEELEFADHAAEVGDFSVLREYRDLSLSREPDKTQSLQR